MFDFQLFSKPHRAQVTPSRMPPNPIVITFDIAEDFRPRLFNRFKDAALDQFGFEAGKEAFCHRIVVAVAFRAHDCR